MTTTNFLKIQKLRHSVFNLDSPINYTEKKISDLIQKSIALSPTAFNSHSVKHILYTKNDHVAFWNEIISEVSKSSINIVSKRKIIRKIKTSYQCGYGTVLFFTDISTLANLNYDNTQLFNFSEQNHAIAEYAVWLMLSDLGLGASLQHYDFVLNKIIYKKFNIPSSWIIRSQMPFGSSKKG